MLAWSKCSELRGYGLSAAWNVGTPRNGTVSRCCAEMHKNDQFKTSVSWFTMMSSLAFSGFVASSTGDLLQTTPTECIDCVIPLTENHRRRTLHGGVQHDIDDRPRMSLGPGIPQPPTPCKK